MAIVIHGMKCRICDKPMVEGDELVAFPPLTGNEKDAVLQFFNDATFHLNCFEGHPHASRIKTIMAEYEKHRVRPKLCHICGEIITNPDDWFGLGMLSEDQDNPLYVYNFLQFHIFHLAQFSELRHVYNLLVEQHHSGQWDGTGVRRFLAELEEHLD